jgi:hypothetical protein
MRIFKNFLLFLFVSVLLLVGFFLFKYVSWEKKFLQEEIRCYSNIDVDLEIEEKIEKFIVSDSRTESIVFTQEEVLSILKSNIEVGDLFVLKDICIKPSKGMWSVYLSYGNNTLKLPWIRQDVVKDDRETAELYVREMFLGSINITRYLRRSALVDINKGIADAIILVNENRFLGREIRNIELLEDRVVVKGVR